MGMYFDRTPEFELELVDFIGARFLKNKAIKRLRGLRFLGVLDYSAKVPTNRSYTRYDHSISVAHLTLRYSRNIALSLSDTMVGVLAALIHDIGHLAFSHSAESLLSLRGDYHYTHHSNLKQTKIRATTKMLLEGLPASLRREFSSVDQLSETIGNLLEGPNKGEGPQKAAWMFNNAFCPDTFDGVERAYWSLQPILKSEPINPLKLVDEISQEGEPLVFRSAKEPGRSHILGKFHRHTRELYRRVIYNRERMAAEAMLTRALEIAYSDKKNVRHTHLTEAQVIKDLAKKPHSMELFESVRRGDLFIPLSLAEPSLFREANDEFAETLMSRDKPGKAFMKFRRRIEDRLSRSLGIQPQHVIPFAFSPLIWKWANLKFPFFRSGEECGGLRRVEWKNSEGRPAGFGSSGRKLEIYIPPESIP